MSIPRSGAYACFGEISDLLLATHVGSHLCHRRDRLLLSSDNVILSSYSSYHSSEYSVELAYSRVTV